MRHYASRMMLLGFLILFLASRASAQWFQNSQRVPQQILLTGTDLSTTELSPNAMQLASQLQLLPLFSEIDRIEDQLRTAQLTREEALTLKVQLLDIKQKVDERIHQAQLEVDFVLAEILDEQNLTKELIASFTEKRDRNIAITNAVGFGLNGALWAVAEALAIPTFQVPKYSIPSGTIGILAGIIPSVASGYALAEVTGGHYSSPAQPNMLAKFFNRPTNLSNAYPESVWTFLTTVPAGESKTRHEQIIERWIADKNIPDFKSTQSKDYIDFVTGSVALKKKLTIKLLMGREAMLQQLGGEVGKMKRLLLELILIENGKKSV